MESTSLQADRSLPQSRRKRSLSLPRFGRSSTGERPDAAKRSVEGEARNPQDAVLAQRAAAWQWYTRGVGEAVLPTKRPTGTPTGNRSAVDGSSKQGDQHTTVQKTPLEVPPRVASRFKAEASSFARVPSAAATPSTPLYDEFELSGLRTQMADFVQRLQQQPPKHKEQPSANAVADATKSMKPLAPTVAERLRRPAVADPAGKSAGGVASAAANSNYQQLVTPRASSATVTSTVLFPMRPFSALHRLFRKMVSGSILKSSKNATISPTDAAAYDPEVLSGGEEDPQYYHHHYIHHHHHHYHYGQSPEKSTAILRSACARRRHSESGSIRPQIQSAWEEDSDAEEAEVERSPIEAYLARRRRRHSDSFTLYQTSKEVDFDEEIPVKADQAAKALPVLPRQSHRRYNSERFSFSPNKIRSMDRKDSQAEPAGEGSRDDIQERLSDIKSRWYPADYQNSRADAAGEAGLQKEVGGGGGKIGGGTYKLGGGGGDATMPEVAQLLGGRRRHSEGFQSQPEGKARYEVAIKRTPSPGRPHRWHSPSARYPEDVLERRTAGASAMANACAARRLPRSRELPPLYPQ